MTGFNFLKVGVETTIIGLGVVFSVLVGLSLIIRVLNSLDDLITPKKSGPEVKAAPVKATPVPEKPKAPVSEPGLSPKPRGTGISPAVVAAITTVVCLMTGRASSDLKFTNIKRAGGGQSLWSATGTTDIIALRQRYSERGTSYEKI